MSTGLSVKVIIGLIVIGLVEIPAFSSTLDDELQKLKDAGIPTTLEELNLPEIPDEENGAAIYRRAFELMDFLYNEKHRELSNYLPYQGTVGWDKVPEEQREKVIDLILGDPEFAKMYQLLEKASLMKCRFFSRKDYEKDLVSVSKDLLSLLSSLRACARTLAEKAKIEAEYGDINKAVHASLVGLRFPKCLSNEPFIVSQLIRNAMNTIALITLEEVINKGDGSPELYQSIVDEMEKGRKSELINYALKGELVIWWLPEFDRLKKLGEEAFEFTEEDKKRIEEFFVISQEMVIKQKKKEKEMIKQSYLKSGCKSPEEFFERQEITYLEMVSVLISLTQKPYWEVREELLEIKSAIEELDEGQIYTKMMLSSISRAYTEEAKCDAYLGVAEIALANRIYKLKHGRYVDSLGEFVPGVLSSVPLDPFTGKEYVYKKKGKAFIIYSIGENLKDDGGISYKEKGWRGDCDIVWECSN